MKKLIATRKGESFEVIVDADFSYEKGVFLTPKGYAVINTKGKTIKLHRYIMDAPEGIQVDHINGNKLDNRKENLRLVDNQGNQANIKAKGASFDKSRNKWVALIMLDGKSKFLGRFDTEEEAQQAYRKAHSETFGEFSPWREGDLIEQQASY